VLTKAGGEETEPQEEAQAQLRACAHRRCRHRIVQENHQEGRQVQAQEEGQLWLKREGAGWSKSLPCLHVYDTQVRAMQVYTAVYASGKISRLWLGSKMGYTLLGASTLSSCCAALDAAWSTVSWILVRNEAVAVANQRPPPSWKDPRWPPQSVVQSSVYGFCLNSSYGMAALEEIYHSVSKIHPIPDHVERNSEERCWHYSPDRPQH
jgi:hypothetical protein